VFEPINCKECDNTGIRIFKPPVGVSETRVHIVTDLGSRGSAPLKLGGECVRAAICDCVWNRIHFLTGIVRGLHNKVHE
jgi:hypothetical protein